jgi:chemotaxis protein MotB
VADEKPIVIIKKKGHHGGHHGGAWKVAYADFVTAMMAFFMVMWLVNSAAEPVKKSVATYFRKPGIFETGSGTPLQIGGSGILEDAQPPKPEEKKKGSGSSSIQLKSKGGATEDEFVKKKGEAISGQFEQSQGPKQGLHDHPVLTSNEPPEKKIEKLFEEGVTVGEKSEEDKKREINDPHKISDEMEKTTAEAEKISSNNEAAQLAAKLAGAAKAMREELLATPELKALSERLDIKVDKDGLSIEVMDTARDPMFEAGADTILADARVAFHRIGAILGRIPNTIDVVGHTDAKRFDNGTTSNWELSTSRANAARRLLLESGVDTDQITSVIGRADRELKRPDNPLDPSNRRITLRVIIKETKDSFNQKLAAAPPREEVFKETKEPPMTTKKIMDKIKEPYKLFLPGEEPGKKRNILPPNIFGEAPIVPRDDFFTNY